MSSKPFPDTTSQGQRPERLIAAGLLTLFITLSPGRLLSWDVGQRLLVARHLWTSGSVNLPPDTPGSYQMVYVEETKSRTSYFGMGQTFLFIPFDILGRGLSLLSQAGAEVGDRLETLPIVFLYVPFMGLFWWWLMVKWGERLTLSRKESLLSATLLTITSAALLYSSQTAQEESVVGAAVLFALLKWDELRQNPAPKSLFWAGILTTLPFLFRLNAVFVLLSVAGFVFENRKSIFPARKHFLPAILGASIPLLLVLLFNYLRFKNPFESGYGVLWRFEPYVSQGIPLGEMRPGIASLLLFGPGKGWFTLSPPLFLALFGILFIKKNRFLWAGLLIGLIASALFHSRLKGFPDGSECWGSRYQGHFLGLFTFPLWVGLKRVAQFRFGKALSASLLVLGFFIQLSACFAPDSLEYLQALPPPGRTAEYLLGEDGQFPRRVKNIGRWLAGEELDGSLPQIKTLEAHYFPNLWGPAYAKKSSSGFVLAWGLMGLLALLLLTRGATTVLRSDSPSASS